MLWLETLWLTVLLIRVGTKPILVESSNRSLRLLLPTAGVGEGANVAGPDDRMKDCPTAGLPPMPRSRSSPIKLSSVDVFYFHLPHPSQCGFCRRQENGALGISCKMEGYSQWKWTPVSEQGMSFKCWQSFQHVAKRQCYTTAKRNVERQGMLYQSVPEAH